MGSALHSLLLRQQAGGNDPEVWGGKAAEHPAMKILKRSAARQGLLAEEDGSRDLLKGTMTEQLKPGQARVREPCASAGDAHTACCCAPHPR